jgi:hypothetical protein
VWVYENKKDTSLRKEEARDIDEASARMCKPGVPFATAVSMRVNYDEQDDGDTHRDEKCSNKIRLMRLQATGRAGENNSL